MKTISLPEKQAEERIKVEMVRNHTIKNIRRKNLEVIIEKQILTQQSERQHHHEAELNVAMHALKTLTLSFLLRLAGSLFQSLISVVSCVTYIVATYYEKYHITIIPFSDQLFSLLEVIFVSLFSIDYGIGFYNAKNKRQFLTNGMNILDLLTILPVFTSFLPGQNQDTVFSKFVGVVRILRVLRILRLYRLFYATNPDQSKGAFTESSEIKKKIMMISATIMAIVFIATGIIYQFNRMSIGGYNFVCHIKTQSRFSMALPLADEQLTFDAAFYYMIVTICTVGYGDITPSSDFSRIVIGLFIIMIIVLVSKQTSELNELMKFNSEFRVPYRGAPGKHILIIGNTSANTLSKFLKEFYHPDHNMQEDFKVVIIQEKEPCKEMLSVLTHANHQENLHFIVGNIFREKVMKMAQLNGNKVFILNNQFSADSKKDDIFALLATKAIHDYDPTSKLYVQLVDPDFLLHSWADWDVVMSTESYKMGIIASNAFNQGFCTFISNLIMSTSISSSIKTKFPEWVVDYCDGLSQEFYLVGFHNDVQHKYIGFSFEQAVQQIYSKFGILLIGIRTISLSEQSGVSHYDVLMNPTNYIIKELDEAIIISDDQEAANSIWTEEATIILPAIKHDLIIKPEDIQQWNQSQRHQESEGTLTHDHYFMWETDLRGTIKNHFIIFGQLDHLSALLVALKHYTNQYVFFVSDKSPDERWAKLRRNHPNVIYLESSLSDVDELCRTAIEDCFHVIMLTWFVPESSIQDSGILPVVRIIEENFKNIRFTLELLDESNLKYLNYRPRKELGNISYSIWPRYASSNVFFSSAMDYIMAGAFHMESIVEIVGKLINSNIAPNISGIEENNQINVLRLPDSFAQYKYIDLFKQFIKQRMIPLAIVREKQEDKNQIPVVIINPHPYTQIVSGDKILIMGTIDMSNVSDSFALQQTFKALNPKTSIQIIPPLDANVSTNDELLTLAKRIIEEDELLNVQDPQFARQIEAEFNMSPQDRLQLISQNEELKSLLNDFSNLKKKFNKK